MLLFLLSCLSVLLLSKSFLKPHPISKIQPRLWAFLWSVFSSLKGFLKFVLVLNRKRRFVKENFQVGRYLPLVSAIVSPRFDVFDNIEKGSGGISLLSLPDLVLDCVLEKLSPAELCVLSVVSRSLNDKCSSDYLWEKHFNQKWSGVFGEASWEQWRKYNSSKSSPREQNCRSQFPFVPSFSLWKLRPENRGQSDSRTSSLENSFMSLYSALETGKFWFPAQVHDREVQNGYVGFALSSYDALLCYDSSTDIFIARYPCQGRSVVEDDIKWYRIRSPPVDTPSSVAYISHCLDELRPDDHIEIQWRKDVRFPYGWWYGIVGHLDTCSGNSITCHCHISDTVMLEFRQYALGSRWRRVEISRKDHREVGNKVDGFYGGVRRILKQQEISKWQSFWPKNATTHP